MCEFNVGDVVVLKSSTDTQMTIETITGDSANCSWLNKSKKQEFGTFKRTSLTKPINPFEGYEGGVAVRH